MKQILLALAALTLVFAGCKKDGKKSTEEILKGHTWRISEAYLDDELLTFEPCQDDNTESFLADSVYVINFGAVKCYPSQPQTVNGTWYLNGNELTTSWDGLIYTYTITSINDFRFEAKYPFPGNRTVRKIYKAI